MRYILIITFFGVSLSLFFPLLVQGASPTDFISKVGDSVSGGDQSIINPQGIWGAVYAKIQQANTWSRNQIGIDFLKLAGWIWNVLKYLSGIAIQFIERMRTSLGS